MDIPFYDPTEFNFVIWSPTKPPCWLWGIFNSWGKGLFFAIKSWICWSYCFFLRSFDPPWSIIWGNYWTYMILLWPLASSIKGPSVNKHFSTKKETLESQMRSVQVIEPESGWKSMEIILFTWDIFTLSGKTQDQDVQECVISKSSKSWISSRILQVSSHCPNQWHRPVVHGSLQDGLAPARLVMTCLLPTSQVPEKIRVTADTGINGVLDGVWVISELISRLKAAVPNL